MKLKVCGMKYPKNIEAVAKLQPDYLGFIFYEKSSRNFESIIPNLPKSIKKVGVFVDASLGFILEKIEKHRLDVVQLHGKESSIFCDTLSRTEITSAPHLKIIKAFSIKNDFNFEVLQPYEKPVDYFLFDTKGKLPGGNGYTFNWNILEDYSSTKPYFLSGGIGLGEIENINAFKKSSAAKHCYAVDVNSRFENKPGHKKTDKLREFNNKIALHG